MNFPFFLFTYLIFPCLCSGLQCKKGLSSSFYTSIKMTECSEEMQYCFASSCALENVVMLAWDCIAHANCDETNKNYGKGLNLTSSPCRCQFGAKGVDWGNENLTFSPAASATTTTTTTPAANLGFCPIPTFYAVLMAAAIGIAIAFHANIVGYGFNAA